MNVNFDSTPPIYIPFGFFLLGSIFAIFANITILNGPYDFSFFNLSRAAIIHLFTIGFFLTTMLGALFQVLPIIIGINIVKQNAVAILTSIGITLGSLVLFMSFKKQIATLPVASLLLIITSILFIFSSLKPILGSATKSHTKTAIVLALVSLSFTIIFGFLNTYKYFSPELNSFPSIREMHIWWGLLGWVPLLIMGVSFQVIPMFHVTPNYPSKLSFSIPILIFASLVICSVASIAFGLSVYTVSIVSYLVMTITILLKRKRKIFDPTVRFWFLALTCALLAIALAWWAYLSSSSLLLRLAIITQLFGFAGSVILGMQHKIIPFLVFMHLQKKGFEPPYPVLKVPQMNEVLPKSLGKLQFYVHATWLALLGFETIHQGFTGFVCAAGILNFGLLAYCTIKGFISYKSTLDNNQMTTR